MMRCETCGNESPVIQRVVIAKDYNRSLSRPIYNCPACYEKKEQGEVSQRQQKEQQP